MNKIELKKKLKESISLENLKSKNILHLNLKQEVLNVLKDYYEVDEKSCKLTFKILKNGEIIFNLNCVIKEKMILL